MAETVISGRVELRIGGKSYPAVGDFTLGFGRDKRESNVGHTGRQGTKSEVQIPYIEGAITFDNTVEDIDEILEFDGVNCSIQQGKRLFTLLNATYVGEGTMNSADAQVTFRAEGDKMDIVKGT